MMHILLIILKIIGIVLLTAVGFLLLILLLALFCPVVYRGRFTRTADRMTGSVSVSWLFRLVWVTAFYNNGEHGFRIRLLGIPLDAVGRLLVRLRGERTKPSGQDSAKKKNPEYAKRQTDSDEKENGKSTAAGQITDKEKNDPDRTKVSETARTTEQAKEHGATGQSTEGSETEEPAGNPEKKLFFLVRIWRGIVSFFRMLIGLPGRILRAIRNFFQKITAVLQKIYRFRELLFSEEFASAFGLVRGSVGKLIRHVRPGKIRGYLKFGFDDPYYTGLCLGAVSVVYPWYCKTLKIEPDFQHKALETDLYLRGRVFGVYALYIFIRIYFDKNVKYMINRFRDKEAR